METAFGLCAATHARATGSFKEWERGEGRSGRKRLMGRASKKKTESGRIRTKDSGTCDRKDGSQIEECCIMCVCVCVCVFCVCVYSVCLPNPRY